MNGLSRALHFGSVQAVPRRFHLECTLATFRSHALAGQEARLLHPSGALSFVELVVLMDVEVARVLVLGLAGEQGAVPPAALRVHVYRSKKACGPHGVDIGGVLSGRFEDRRRGLLRRRHRNVLLDQFAHAGIALRV